MRWCVHHSSQFQLEFRTFEHPSTNTWGSVKNVRDAVTNASATTEICQVDFMTTKRNPSHAVKELNRAIKWFRLFSSVFRFNIEWRCVMVCYGKWGGGAEKRGTEKRYAISVTETDNLLLPHEIKYTLESTSTSTPTHESTRIKYHSNEVERGSTLDFDSETTCNALFTVHAFVLTTHANQFTETFNYFTRWCSIINNSTDLLFN